MPCRKSKSWFLSMDKLLMVLTVGLAVFAIDPPKISSLESSSSVSDDTKSFDNLNIRHFEKLSNEIIENVANYLHAADTISEFCKTSPRNKALVIDKARLYDPTIKVSASELTSSLRKWKICKFEIKEDTTIIEMVKKQKEGYYIDPNQLLEWTSDSKRKLNALYGHESLLLSLFKAEAYNPTDNDNSAFQTACWNGFTKVVKLLLEFEGVNPSVDWAIKWASVNDKQPAHAEQVVEALLTNTRLKFTMDNIYMIQFRWNDNPKIKELLTVQKDKSTDSKAIHDYYSLKWASYYGHTETVKRLLAEERVDPSAEQNEAIKLATERGNEKVVRLLLADDRLNLTPDVIQDLEFYWNNNPEIIDLLHERRVLQINIKID